MTNEEERIQDILLFTQLMREDSECQSCRKTPMRLEEISNRLTRIETMLMHISNGQLLLPSSQSCTPRSVPSSGIDNFTSISSGAASASSTSPVKIREWYRKRREYESQRIFTYCSRMFRPMTTGQVLDMLRNDEMLHEVINCCRVEYDDFNKAKQYTIERVVKHMHTLELYQTLSNSTAAENQEN